MKMIRSLLDIILWRVQVGRRRDKKLHIIHCLPAAVGLDDFRVLCTRREFALGSPRAHVGRESLLRERTES